MLINKKIVSKKRDKSGNIVSQTTEFFTGEHGQLTVKYIDENGVVYNADIKYDEQGRMVYYHMLKGDKETKYISTYKDNISNTLATSYKLVDGVEYNLAWDEQGRLVNPIAIEKAKKYNALYNGLFLHSCCASQIDGFLTKTGEACVSTVRSNTVFNLEFNPWVLIGFGHIRQLFDFDAYTQSYDLDDADHQDGVSTVDDRSASDRVHTHNTPQSTELHNVNYKNVPKSDAYTNFNEDLYYDEGFMQMQTAEIILVVIGKCSSVNELVKTKNLIKQHYPYVKFLTQQQFSKIKKSEELLRLVYITKQEQKADEIKDGELGMYDEKVLSSFKMYLNHSNKLNF